MKTVELSAALNSAQVVENLKNFVGVDAQGAAALMTPERLAAVAGESIKRESRFYSGMLTVEQTGGDTPIDVAKEISGYLPNEECTFSLTHKKWVSHFVIGYISNDKQYGKFIITNFSSSQFTFVSLEAGVFK